ncbi:HD-GYP domain-containing protein [Bacillus carboniphilus]|uniref:HD-GYP domain-containing protein n=1 Tax=Bacillus carboniphilus TaxID=86663 RepID=A0ABP3G3G3_9BACI
MKVKVYDLIEGCIINKDVYSKSNHPIVLKRTVVNQEVLEVLEAFLIDEVEVEKLLENGDPFPNEGIGEETSISSEKTSFYTQYMSAVDLYKNEFKSWQAGSPIDILKIRDCIIPLFISFTKKPEELVMIHRYAKKQDYLYHHSVATGLISGFLAIKSNLPAGEAAQIAIAGILADCGLARVDQKVLKKLGKNTFEEKEEIKKHPLYSYKLIQNIPSIKDATKLAILQHHERLDGSGYPQRESANRIHKFSRVISIAAYYHEMCSGEGNFISLSPFKVVENMIEDSFGKFDLEIVQNLVRYVAGFSLGSTVKLNDGSIGDVMFVDSKAPLRPIIKIKKSEQLLDLRNNRKYFIDKIIH